MSLRRALLNLAPHSAIYGLGIFLNKILGFLLLPVYTRFLSPADYGVFSLLNVSGTMLKVLVCCGCGQALIWTVIHRGTDDRLAHSTAFHYLGAQAVVLLAVLWPLAPWLSERMFGSAELSGLLRCVFLWNAVELAETMLLARLRMRRKAVSFSAMAMSRFLLGALLNVLFVAGLRRGVPGLVWANLLTSAAMAAASVALLRPVLQWKFSPALLRQLLFYGLPLIPSQAANLVMTSSDRFFLQHSADAAEVGLYSLGYNAGMVINLLVYAVEMAWLPVMFEMARARNAARDFARLLTYYVAALGFGWLALSALGRELLHVMAGPAFRSAHTVIPLVAAAHLLGGVRAMTNVGLSTRNKMHLATPVVIGAALLNLLLNALLIPPYRSIGAAWATLLSYAFLCFAQTAVNQRVWRIPYESGRLARAVAALGLLFALSQLVRTPHVALDVLVKMLLLAAFPALLGLFGFFAPSELAWLSRLRRLGPRGD